MIKNSKPVNKKYSSPLWSKNSKPVNKKYNPLRSKNIKLVKGWKKRLRPKARKFFKKLQHKRRLTLVKRSPNRFYNLKKNPSFNDIYKIYKKSDFFITLHKPTSIEKKKNRRLKKIARMRIAAIKKRIRSRKNKPISRMLKHIMYNTVNSQLVNKKMDIIRTPKCGVRVFPIKKKKNKIRKILFKYRKNISFIKKKKKIKDFKIGRARVSIKRINNFFVHCYWSSKAQISHKVKKKIKNEQ